MVRRFFLAALGTFFVGAPVASTAETAGPSPRELVALIASGPMELAPARWNAVVPKQLAAAGFDKTDDEDGIAVIYKHTLDDDIALRVGHGAQGGAFQFFLPKAYLGMTSDFEAELERTTKAQVDPALLERIVMSDEEKRWAWRQGRQMNIIYFISSQLRDAVRLEFETYPVD